MRSKGKGYTEDEKRLFAQLLDKYNRQESGINSRKNGSYMSWNDLLRNYNSSPIVARKRSLGQLQQLKYRLLNEQKMRVKTPERSVISPSAFACDSYSSEAAPVAFQLRNLRKTPPATDLIHPPLMMGHFGSTPQVPISSSISFSLQGNSSPIPGAKVDTQPMSNGSNDQQSTPIKNTSPQNFTQPTDMNYRTPSLSSKSSSATSTKGNYEQSSPQKINSTPSKASSSNRSEGDEITEEEESLLKMEKLKRKLAKEKKLRIERIRKLKKISLSLIKHDVQLALLKTRHEEAKEKLELEHVDAIYEMKLQAIEGIAEMEITSKKNLKYALSESVL